MSKIIHWRSKMTDAEGHGTIAFPDNKAEKIVKKMNEENPELYCWAEDVKEEE